MPSAAPDRAEHHPQDPSRSSRCPAGSSERRAPAPSSGSWCLLVVPDRRGTPAAAARPRRRRPPSTTGSERRARVDRQLAARPGTGRPWCRSSGGPAPRRPRRPRRRRGSTCRANPWPANELPRRRQDRRAGVGRARPAAAAAAAAAAGARGRSRRRRDREVLAGELQRLHAGRASRSSRSAALRVLISSTMWPSKPVAGEVLEERRRAPRAAARAPGARPWPSRCRRSGGCGAAASPSRSAIATGSDCGDRGVREVDGGVGVGLLRGVPAGQVHLHAAPRARPATGTCSRPRTRCRSTPRAPRCPRRSSRRSRAASGTAGARRPRRRRPPWPSRRERSSLPHGSVPQTRWVNSRHGACTAHDRAARGGRRAAGPRRSAG